MRKKERQKILSEYWSHPSINELDVADKGDHLEVSSCSGQASVWWMGTLRAAFPQDSYISKDHYFKMRPAAGVTLKLNRDDGTLTIKGKKHLEWFRDHFENLLQNGSTEFTALIELGKQIDSCLRLDDGNSVSNMLLHLPATGALKHGPTFNYRLWRYLLDHWIGSGGDIYIVSPYVDARRVADILLLIVKHRLSNSRVHLYTLPRCDGDFKFPRVFRESKEIVRALRSANKRRLVAEERLSVAMQRLEARFGGFQCKFIACWRDDYAELLLTSANFHGWHFERDNVDVVAHFHLPPEDLINNYLAPLGLTPQISMRAISPDSTPLKEFFDSSMDSTLP